MQQKASFQLPLISLTKFSILGLMLFSISACSGSNDSTTDKSPTPSTPTEEQNLTEDANPAAESPSLDTALTNFKSVASEAGLTEN